MAGIQESVPTPCQTLLTELPFYELGDWLLGTRRPHHNSPLLPSPGAPLHGSTGSTSGPCAAVATDETAGCELARVPAGCEAESAGQGLCPHALNQQFPPDAPRGLLKHAASYYLVKGTDLLDFQIKKCQQPTQ